MALLLTSGIAYQRVAGDLDLSQYPFPGRLVDVGGRKLHLYCVGSGSPTVVLESGHGSGMLTWAKVQAEVSQWTRVCSYDRAGYGWSELSPQPRSASRIAEDLRVLLEKAEEEAPFVLVGHSLGGVYAQYFTSSHPDLVAGLVLVDATHENTFKHLPALFRWTDWLVEAEQKLRVAGTSRLHTQSTDPTVRAFQNSNKQLQAMASEEEMTSENLAELTASGTSLGDLPLIVLTSEQTNQIEFIRPLQASFLERSRNSRQVIVEGSTHAIQESRPEAVISVVWEIVEAVRREPNSSTATSVAEPQ